MSPQNLSPAWQYAKRAAARLFELGQIKREVSVGLMERVIWRAFCDGRSADEPHGNPTTGAESLTVVEAAALEGVQVVDTVVHHLHHGIAPCGRMTHVPRDWPAGHKWSADWADVTCDGCLRCRPVAIQTEGHVGDRPSLGAAVLRATEPPGTIDPWPRTSPSSRTKKRRGSATTSATRSRKR